LAESRKYFIFQLYMLVEDVTVTAEFAVSIRRRKLLMDLPVLKFIDTALECRQTDGQNSYPSIARQY